MGRKPSRNKNLPQGMRARHRTSGTYYYLDTSGTPRREIALGSDYALAVKKWAELTVNAQPRRAACIQIVIGAGCSMPCTHTLRQIFISAWLAPHVKQSSRLVASTRSPLLVLL